MTSESSQSSSFDANHLPRRLVRGVALVSTAFGIFRVVSVIGQTALDGVGRWWSIFSPAAAQWVSVAFVLVTILLATLLMIGGIGLYRRWRAARLMLMLWAILDLVVYTAALTLSFISYMQYLSARTSRPPRGLTGTSYAFSMVSVFIEHIPLPLSVFLIMRLPQVKALWLSETSRTPGFDVIPLARVAAPASSEVEAS